MQAATWVNCRADFALDGALIDLIAPGTGQVEWEAFWAALRSGPFGLRVFRDGELIALPESASWVFAERNKAAVVVPVLSGTVTANCHFFGGNLELDIDPREVECKPAFESVLELMRFVAHAVGRAVLATPEGRTSEHAFIQATPDGRADLLPSRASPGAESR